VRKFLAVFLLFFCFVSEAFSQKSLSDYSYVIVPEKFDFVNEKDKYQLNSLTKFLFNKHGFNAFFYSEAPNVKRCDGLYAEVEGKPAVIRTKVTVILNDCNGNEVYRTAVGKSKIKEYSKTYTAALRQAFLSIDSLDVQQRDPIALELDEPSIDKTEFSDTEVTKTNSDGLDKKSVVEAFSFEADDTLYTQNGVDFILKPSGKDFVLIERQEKVAQLKGRIKLTPESETPFKFEDNNGNKFPCYFDDNQNLIIETSFQKLKFDRVDQ